MAVKKIPMRRCLGCMESFPKKELVRMVRAQDGEISLDFTGKKNGRGAYLCKKTECFLKARKAKRFERALESQIPDQVYESMGLELERENG